MAWLALVVAGLFEVAWAVGMKKSNNFSHPGWIAFTLVTMILSVAFLYWAVQRLPLGTAYAVWTGIGAVGTALLGIYLFNESPALPRLVCIGLVILGVIGLKLTH